MSPHSRSGIRWKKGFKPIALEVPEPVMIDRNSNAGRVLIALHELTVAQDSTGHDDAPMVCHHWDEMERRTGLDRGAISRALVSLEQQGLVDAVPSSTDSGAHVGQAFISPAGMGLVDQLLAHGQRGHLSQGRVQERFKLLATLIDAFLQVDDVFIYRTFVDSPDPEIKHPGLAAPFNARWSHIDALAREGLLYVTGNRGQGTINIPTRVIESYEANARQAVAMPPGPLRIEALAHSHVTYNMTTNNNWVSGGNVNIAQSSKRVDQTITAGVNAGELEDLLRALHDLQLPPELIESLRDAVEEAGEDGPSRGKAALAWLGRATHDVTTNALGGAAASQLPAVTSLITNYALALL